MWCHATARPRCRHGLSRPSWPSPPTAWAPFKLGPEGLLPPQGWAVAQWVCSPVCPGSVPRCPWGCLVMAGQGRLQGRAGELQDFMLWSVLPYFIDPLGIREPFTSPLRSALKELVKIASGRKAEAGCWPLRSSFMLQAVPSSSWCLWGLGASEAGGDEAWAPCLLLFLKPLSITSYLKPHVCRRDTKL